MVCTEHIRSRYANQGAGKQFVLLNNSITSTTIFRAACGCLGSRGRGRPGYLGPEAPGCPLSCACGLSLPGNLRLPVTEAARRGKAGALGWGRCSYSWDLIHHGHPGTRLPGSRDRSQQRDFYSFFDRIGKRMILKEGLNNIK